MTIPQQLVLAIIREIIMTKQRRRIFPDYALITEINIAVRQALDTLVASGYIIERKASVNCHPAYVISDEQSQT